MREANLEAIERGPEGVSFISFQPWKGKLQHGITLRNLHDDPGAVFLDQHARHVKRLAGLDLSDIQVRLAQRRLADMIAAGSAEIVQGDAAALPWADESFSAATCMGSLEFIADSAAALREMWRVLRPGGGIVVSYGLDPEADLTYFTGCKSSEGLNFSTGRPGTARSPAGIRSGCCSA